MTTGDQTSEQMFDLLLQSAVTAALLRLAGTGTTLSDGELAALKLGVGFGIEVMVNHLNSIEPPPSRPKPDHFAE